MNRAILHVDMNSYFATVEQQANPLLRGKPIAVSGRPNISSVVATASVEAKKFGVKAGMTTFEAKRLCPKLIFIPGDPTKYVFVTSQFVKIFRSYTPLVEMFSIDEAFLDVTNYLQPGQTPVEIALQIKRKIRETIGGKITCSIGIAPNKFLAKLASEKKKPDGLTVVDKNNLDEILLGSKLTDFCGIGHRVSKRLAEMGIYSVQQLRKVPKELLISSFGTVRGQSLFEMSFGIDDSPVLPEENREEPKSYSHNLTLPKATSDWKYVWATLLRLSEKVARRMREDELFARNVFVFLRTPEMTGIGGQKMIGHYVNDGISIFETAKEVLLQNELPQMVRSVGVGVAYLQTGSLVNGCLFPEVSRKENIVGSMDQANDRFGENTVFLASTLPCFEREKRVAGIRIRLRFN